MPNCDGSGKFPSDKCDGCSQYKYDSDNGLSYCKTKLEKMADKRVDSVMRKREEIKRRNDT